MLPVTKIVPRALALHEKLRRIWLVLSLPDIVSENTIRVLSFRAFNVKLKQRKEVAVVIQWPSSFVLQGHSSNFRTRCPEVEQGADAFII